MDRRVLISTAIFGVFSSRDVAAQPLAKTVYSEELRISQSLQSATTVEEVNTLAAEWDDIYLVHASALDANHKSDMEKISTAIVGLIEGVVKDPVKQQILKALVPKTLVAFEALATRFKYLGPVFAFIEASTPSGIASDAVEVHQANKAMQRRIRDQIHIVTGEPLFYETMYLQIDLTNTGPSIGLP